MNDNWREETEKKVEELHRARSLLLNAKNPVGANVIFLKILEYKWMLLIDEKISKKESTGLDGILDPRD